MSQGSGGRRSSGDNRGGQGGDDKRRRGGGDRGQNQGGDRNRSDLIDKLVKIRRCACVVKGGRRFSFTAMVVVGNGKGKVGVGYAKANEVPPAVEKATREGGRTLMDVNMTGHTIPHLVEGHFGAAHVVLLPASAGTGVIAGAAVRAVCEAAGIHNILTKSFGSTNPHNLVKATLDALRQLRSRQDVERLRGVSLS
ncbi:MAG: 30S ribosomal protein S5 [Pirellula sp.]|nr:30S ribosomal protein S5 [Pirellula sp.]